MSNNSKALKSGVWYTIGNFIAKGASFLTVPIFTRILSVDDVGKFANFTSWLSIFIIITTFELCSSINIARFDFKEDINDYISSNLIQGSLITTAFFGVFFVFRKFFLELFSLGMPELLVMYIYCLTCPALQMYQLKCRIDFQYKMSVFVSLLSVFSSTLLSLACVFCFDDKYVGRYIGYAIPFILIHIVIYVVLLRKSKKLSIKKYWKYALIISFPLIWHTLAGNVLTSSDRVMINYFQGSNDVALYSIAYSCASIVQLLWISMNSAWTPWAMEMIDQKKYSAMNRALKPYCIFFGFVVICFLLVAPEVLLLMGGPAYASALSVIPPIMISYVFNFAYSFYVIIEQYEKKQIIIAASTIVAAIVNVVLNLILLPKYGYSIAAYTTLVGYITLFLMHFLSCKIMKKEKIVNNRFVFVFLLFFIGCMFFVPVLYAFSSIRYGLIGLFLAVCIITAIYLRKELHYLIKNKSFVLIKEKLAGLRVANNEKNRN